VSLVRLISRPKLVSLISRPKLVSLGLAVSFWRRLMNSEATFNLKTVVAQCLDGHQHAMSQLIDHYHAMVYGLCFRMLGQRQDAEDVTQETFFRVLRNLDRWDANRKFEPWLLTIAGNRCRTKLSQRKRKSTTQVLDYPIIDNRTDNNEGQILEEVQVALGQLRAEYRQVFQMFHFEQKSYEEIAASMKIPQGTVKTWCHRARKEIVEILARRENIVQPKQACSSL